MERRLAAILAADMVGYSKLVSADEVGTIARHKAHRKSLFDPKIAQYGGRIVKTTGDGVLVEFTSVVDAVRCAVEIQKAMPQREAHVAEAERIRYRIGVNLGDIVIEGGDILGDGVNIAARLEGLAEPGGICISRPVHTQIKGKLDLDFESLGKKGVKNIPEPVAVYRVELDDKAGLLVTPVVPEAASRRHRSWLLAGVAIIVCLFAFGGAFWWQTWPPEVEPASIDRMAFPLPNKPSIAVLPFLNLSGDSQQDYFVDGLTEDIITDLSRFTELFVISRTSTFTYKGKSVPVGQIAEELGVRYVVEGSVRRTDAALLITVQLIDATSGQHLWAERYERPVTEFRALGDELLQAIVSTVAGRVKNLGQRIASRKKTENLSAYELVLQGTVLLDRYTKESNETARQQFERAIALDSQYARAYAGYATTCMLDYLFGWSKNGKALLELGREAAIKAVALDNADYHTHQTLGWVYLYEKRFADAMAEFEEGLALNPSDAKSLAEDGYALIYLGEMDKAVEQVQKAMRHDPFHPDWYFDALGWAYYFLGRYEEALRTTSRIASPTAGQHRLLAAIYARLGEREKARLHAAKVLEAEPGFKVSIFAESMPFRDPGVLQDYLGGLKEAGLPE